MSLFEAAVDCWLWLPQQLFVCYLLVALVRCFFLAKGQGGTNLGKPLEHELPTNTSQTKTCNPIAALQQPANDCVALCR